MSKRDDWIDYFELLHGRKPNAEEYMEAKEAGKFEGGPDNLNQNVQMKTSPQQGPSVQSDYVENQSGFSDTLASEQSTYQTNVAGESPNQNYQGGGNSNYYNTMQNQYASPYLVDQRGQEITFKRALDYLFYNPLFGLSIYSGILWLPYLVTILPGWTHRTRRLRDAGLRGKGIFVLYILCLIPFVNIISSIFLLYVACQKSDYFLQNGESFFYRNRFQSPALPNVALPQRKSFGSFFG